MRRLIEELWWKLRYSSRATAWLHFCAMWAPFNSWRLFFYRLRGTRIGKNVYIVQGVFLEESRPWLITIEDGVRIGAGTTVATHDGVYYPSVPYRYAPVLFKRDSTVGLHATVLPGVTVGEGAVVGAGAVVTRDVPQGTVYVGARGRCLDLPDLVDKARERRDEYAATDAATKYPWRMRA